MIVHDLMLPARYWDDYSDRAPVDAPEQMAVEVRRYGNRVAVSANEVQLAYLFSDAKFYAEGNTDDTAPAILRGARRVVELCALVRPSTFG